jgi:hypothetical protein
MRIPGYGRLAKWYSEKRGKAVFEDLKKHIPSLIAGIPRKECSGAINVASFSGSKTFVEQLYSVLSFYYNVGIPNSWTVYSDKTHTAEETALLQQIPGLKVLHWDHNLAIRFDGLLRFGQYNIWGNRLHAYLNHPITTTTIFTDSDILFYKKFGDFIPTLNKQNWFIADGAPHFDRYLTDRFGAPQAPFLNAGFLIFNERPDWESAVQYILNRDDRNTWEHFTEQASIHYMFQADRNKGILDPRYFVLSGSDSFKFGMDFNPDRIAMRHFVSVVRHKMWQTDWQDNLRSV